MKFLKLREGTKQPYNRHNYYESLDNLSDAGIVLDEEEGVIFLDFDNLDSNKNRESKIIEGILKEYPSSLVVNTTRGKHIYYKTDRQLKQWTKGFITIGVECDAKIGNAYGVIKQNGTTREYKGELSFDNLTELPDILLPMKIGKNIENLCGLKEGEGRHTKLLKHLCQVRKNYDDVDIEIIGGFINKYVFDDPMSEEELHNVVNSALNYDIDAIDNSDDNSEKKIIKVCRNLVEKYDIHISNNQLFFLFDGRYINDARKIQKLIYDEYKFSKSSYEEIIFQLSLLAKEEQGGNEIIGLKNGALINGEFDSNYNEFSGSYLDIYYKEDAYDENVDKFLQFITNNDNLSEKNDLRIVIEEMLGHCIMKNHFPHKMFLLIGNGANGKSTFINTLFNMFGDLAVNVPLKQLEKDNYISRLNNKLVNISDDVDFNYIKSSQNVKVLASGDYITARELYEKPYTFKNSCTLIFTMNELIVFSDHSYGMERRLCIIPFENRVKEPDPTLIEKLTTDNAKSYLLKLAVEGMNRIKKNKGQLTNSPTIDNVVKCYLMENDSVYAFLQSEGYLIEGEPYSDVYEKYNSYCSINQFTPLKKNNFSRKLRSKGYKTIVKSINCLSTRVVVAEGTE